MHNNPKKLALPLSGKLAALSLAALFAVINLLPGVASAGFSAIPAPPVRHQFTFELRPGEEKKGAILVENFDTEPVSLNLYGADGTQSDQGTFALTSTTAGQRHVGTWIKISKPDITLESREKKEIPFTIKLPKDVTPGTYSGGIAAESSGIAAESGGPSSDGANGNAVSISARFVVKIFVKVPGEKIHKFEWTDFSYIAGVRNDGIVSLPSFKLSYKNLGNTLIKTEQKISINGFPGLPKTIDVGQLEPIMNPKAELNDPDKTNGNGNLNGLKAYVNSGALVFTPQPAIVLQNSQTVIPVKWPNPPEMGVYKATATVTFYEYDIITGKTLNPQTLTRTISFSIPVKLNTLPGISLVLFLILLIVAYEYVSYRRCIIINAINESGLYTVKPNETLIQIAEDNQISWKILAKINKIKPPYTIKSGQKILVPLKNEKEN